MDFQRRRHLQLHFAIDAHSCRIYSRLLGIHPRSNLKSFLAKQDLPPLSQLQETSHSLLLANKASPQEKQKQKTIPSTHTPLLHPVRTPSLQTSLPHLLPRRRSLRFNPLRRERGRLKTTHQLRLAIMFPEETRALERKYQPLLQRTDRTVACLFVEKSLKLPGLPPRATPLSRV